MVDHKASHDEAANFAGYFSDQVYEEARLQKLDGVGTHWNHQSDHSGSVIVLTVVIPYIKD